METAQPENRNFLRRNLDYIVIGTATGIPAATHILPNISKYLTEGNQQALEKGIYQAGFTAFVAASCYLCLHYLKSR